MNTIVTAQPNAVIICDEFPAPTPKYQIGQRIKSAWGKGIIIGVRYHPPDSALEFYSGGGWHYEISEHWGTDDTRTIAEKNIQPVEAIS